MFVDFGKGYRSPKTNTITDAITGWTGEELTLMGEGCIDIDECDEGIHDCFHFKDDHMYTECFNTDGSYTCDCIDGWAETVTPEGGKKCELILRIVFRDKNPPF